LKTGDWIWSAILGCVIALFINPASRNVIAAMSNAHPVLTGFLKFAVLASMGELLAIRIVSGKWRVPAGVVYRILVWGTVGVFIVVSFAVFTAGVEDAIRRGLLPVANNALYSLTKAVWTSIVINLAFAPVLMVGHRMVDTYLDLAEGSFVKLLSVRLEQVISRIDWQELIRFVCLKTIPLFWTPAHVITFLLPPEYRIIYAAFLSISLGVILAFSKRARQSPANGAPAVPNLLWGLRAAKSMFAHGDLPAGAD